MEKLAFIGVGIMGKSMVRNLMKQGYEVLIYVRDKSKVMDVISEGAVFCKSIKECVKDCIAVITIVGFPTDVEEVYFGLEGILENVKEGTYVIDMTTSSPKLAEKIYMEAKSKGIFALDAPVTGGDVGAKNGTLTILAGGDKEAFELCMPIFQAIGSNIHYEGTAGCGQHTKMANQIMIAGALSGVCEAISYGREKGLNVQKMLDSVASGAAGSKQLELLAPKIMKEDYAPGFFVKHFIKDMKLADEEAEQCGLELKVLKKVLENYEQLAQDGYGDLGTQALIKLYEKV